MQLFLLIQMFAVCMVSAFWFVTKQPSEEDLEDWAVAGIVCKSENEDNVGKILTNLCFYGPWIVDVGSTSFLFFSLSAARVIPWNPDTGMHLINTFDFTRFDNELIAPILSMVFFLSLATYYLDTIFSFR